MKKLGKYKYIIITNLIIFVSYIAIQSVPKLFGIDDTLANTYIFNPNNTISQNINGIITRALSWNIRIGEIFYFIAGCFPRYIYFLFNGLRCLIFFNLIYIFTYGKKSKEYFLKPEYIITLLSSYMITLTIFPAFSEIFIWMGATYNHIFDLIIILLSGLHFRLIADDINILKKYKKLKIPYIILCFISAFTLEHVTPCLILYNLVILIYKGIKDKKKLKTYLKENIFNLLSILTTSLGLIIMYIMSKSRISFFTTQDWIEETKVNMLLRIIQDYSYILITIGICLLIVLIIKKEKKEIFKQLKVNLFMLILSILSLVIIYITPAYYSIRVTLFLYFSLLTILSYLLNQIFTKRLAYIYILIITITLVITTYTLIVFYKDFNDFNDIRKSYITNQYNLGVKNIICPLYDNKKNYFFYKRLASYEDMYCDITYIKYMLNDDDITSNPRYMNYLR